MLPKKLKRLSIVSALFLLAACQHSLPPPENSTPPEVIIQRIKLTIPQNLLVKCDPLEVLDEKMILTMGDLLHYNVRLMQQHTECALRLDNLIEAIITEEKKK